MRSIDTTALPTRIARSGWVARGVVYVLVGVLAIGLLEGPRFDQEDADQAGALQAVAQGPWGSAVLVALAAGLALFGLWQGTQLWLLDGSDLDTWLERIAKAFGIAFYLSLAWTAVNLAVGEPHQQTWTVERAASWTLGRPLGRIGIAVAAAIVIGTAARRGARTITGEFPDDLRLADADQAVRPIVSWLGRLGEVGRAASFAIIGWFLLMAAWSGRSSEAGGLNETLLDTATSGPGRVLVAITAIGFILFGVFSVASAPYRDLDPN